MEYVILQQQDIEELEDAVNERLADGWRPQGGVSLQIFLLAHCQCARNTLDGRDLLLRPGSRSRSAERGIDRLDS